MVSGTLSESMSALDIQFGHGRHGGNVRHYVPSPEEITRACEQIRVTGFTDRLGYWHAPWNEREHYVRRTGKLVPTRLEVQTWSGGG